MPAACSPLREMNPPHVLPIPKGLRPPAQGCPVREATLGNVGKGFPTPTGLRPCYPCNGTFMYPPRMPQPRCGWNDLSARTQGSLADSATLGFATESLWDSQNEIVAMQRDFDSSPSPPRR